MCVVIIHAKTRDFFVELRVDVGIEEDMSIELEDDDGIRLIINNIELGKAFPGGPVCEYKGENTMHS